MAQDTKQSQVPMPCATGCGFYGSPRTNDMCSVCYKDSMQKQKSGERFSPPVTSVGSSGESLAAPRSESGASLPAPAFPLIDTVPEQNSVVSSQALSSQASVTLSEEHEPTVGKRGQKADELKAVAIADSDQSSVEGRVGSLDTPKTNRCFVCRKKLGFTGFGCRCGNVYCGSHRYSDVHNCTFDYKSDAAEKIRKENPVVVGEKINKI